MKVRFSIGAKLILGIGAIIIAILINSYLINNSLEKSRKINEQITGTKKISADLHHH